MSRTSKIMKIEHSGPLRYRYIAKARRKKLIYHQTQPNHHPHQIYPIDAADTIHRRRNRPLTTRTSGGGENIRQTDAPSARGSRFALLPNLPHYNNAECHLPYACCLEYQPTDEISIRRTPPGTWGCFCDILMGCNFSCYERCRFYVSGKSRRVFVNMNGEIFKSSGCREFWWSIGPGIVVYSSRFVGVGWLKWTNNNDLPVHNPNTGPTNSVCFFRSIIHGADSTIPKLYQFSILR